MADRDAEYQRRGEQPPGPDPFTEPQRPPPPFIPKSAYLSQEELKLMTKLPNEVPTLIQVCPLYTHTYDQE